MDAHVHDSEPVVDPPSEDDDDDDDDDTTEGGSSQPKPSSNRDRLVDCMEEFVKYTIIMRPHFDLFADLFSERKEMMRTK